MIIYKLLQNGCFIENIKINSLFPKILKEVLKRNDTFLNNKREVSWGQKQTKMYNLIRVF